MAQLRLDLESNPEFLADLLDEGMTRAAIKAKWGCSDGFVSDRRKKARAGQSIKTNDAAEVTVLTHLDTESELHDPEKGDSYTLMRDTAWGKAEWDIFLREKGQDPAEVTYTWGVTSNPNGGYWNKLLNVRPKGAAEGVPAWPVAQPARDRIIIQKVPTAVPLGGTFKTAVIGADTQIGFDMDDGGTLTPYHDDRAIDIFLQVLALERPEQAIIAGDILDLAEQGRWTQEARFANTTQHALNRGRELAACMADLARRKIWIEGNHDKRMQGFMEANAKASIGLKRAGYPEEWPVMSIPFLVGLDEYDTDYVDAYPAGVHWITDGLRVIHGTKANSKGSTAAQYANEMPHISTVFGHTHRLEVQSKTTFDRAGKIRTMNVNPGCLCRVDGAVPSVHGARHLDGSKATYWEDWQQGVTVIRYRENGTFYVELVQIDEGVGFHGGQELVASDPQT